MTRCLFVVSLLPLLLPSCTSVPDKADIDGYAIELRSIEPQPVVTTRQTVKTGELSQAFAVHIPSTLRFASTNGKVAGQPIAIYHRFAPDSVDVEVGVPVETAIEGEGEVKAGILPGGRVVVTSHLGSYHELSKAHAAMNAWFEKYGVVRRGPCWEVYVSDPGSVAPDKVRTDIYYPIQ